MRRGSVLVSTENQSAQRGYIGIECNLLVVDPRGGCIPRQRQCHVWEKVRPEFSMADAAHFSYFMTPLGIVVFDRFYTKGIE